ncbi:hypothetical protein Leryth_009893 [Lithospermum erythrorhizon]|nr:hypothetical protein Leryth_009893 [Lithospermum erythrorhizon]
MDLRETIVAIFFFLLLATPPSLSRGMKASDMADSAIYEIDYRGPETHAYVPPPIRSGGKHNIHQEMKVHHKSKGVGATSKSGHGKKSHG